MAIVKLYLFRTLNSTIFCNETEVNRRIISFYLVWDLMGWHKLPRIEDVWTEEQLTRAIESIHSRGDRRGQYQEQNIAWLFVAWNSFYKTRKKWKFKYGASVAACIRSVYTQELHTVLMEVALSDIIFQFWKSNNISVSYVVIQVGEDDKKASC